MDRNHLEIFFSPDNCTVERLIELVMDVQHLVWFMAYSLTDDELTALVIEKVGSGLRVSGVLEKSQTRSNTGTEYETLLENGVDAVLDGNPASMHHKVLIIDEKVVVTGSYNFS